MRKHLSLAAASLIAVNALLAAPALASNSNAAEHANDNAHQKNEQSQPQHKPQSSQASAKSSKPTTKSSSQPAQASAKPAKTQTAASGTTSLHNPPGNNGTIKIDTQPFDTAPNNEPHVGCDFQVDFYGYDQGNYYADVTFDGHAPTGGGRLLTDRVFIGQDAAGGGTDLDAEVTYNLNPYLTGITPHPKQGYHVKLTVNADGSIGADTKHKVFWVQNCATTPQTPPATPPGKGGGTPPPMTTTISAPPTDTVAHTASVTQAIIPTVQAIGGGQLPDTGSMLDIFLAAILALGFAGVSKVHQELREDHLQ